MGGFRNHDQIIPSDDPPEAGACLTGADGLFKLGDGISPDGGLGLESLLGGGEGGDGVFELEDVAF